MLSEQGEDGRETGLVSTPKAILVGSPQGTEHRVPEQASKPPPKVEQRLCLRTPGLLQLDPTHGLLPHASGHRDHGSHMQSPTCLAAKS